jgi:hypothetical protein
MKTKKNVKILLLIGILISVKIGLGQQIVLDKPVRVGELTVFPEVSNPNNYYYLPDKIRLGRHQNGLPQFSFIRYVNNVRTVAGSDDAKEGDGGGIVHALIELSVSPAQLTKAQTSLAKINRAGKIIGPIIYKSGTVALISSIARPGGDRAPQILGLGTAPILDGQKCAISVQLNKSNAKLLWETFKTPTPDFSISFEMQLEGYLSPKRVLIEADLDKVYSNRTFEAAVATPVLAAEIQDALEELTETRVIKVTQIGEDEGLNAIMQTAYSQIINQLFDRTGGSGVPDLNQLSSGGANRTSMLDRATTMLRDARQEAREENQRRGELRQQQRAVENQVRSEASTRRNERMNASGRRITPPPANQRRSADSTESTGASIAGGGQSVPDDVPIPSLAVAASFQLKRVRQTGKYVVDLNKYTSDIRTMRFDENIGSPNCEECFREVNLDDPLMKQREIHAHIDGLNAEDFTKYINFVNVVMRKKHQNNEITLDEIQIQRSKFNESGNDFKMLYGWKGDDNRIKWLNYEFKSKWSFFGGKVVETDWKSTEFGSLALTPPFGRKNIFIEVDPDFAAAEGLRALEINIYSEIAGSKETKKVSLKVSQNELSRTAELLLPRDIDNYEYDITYLLKGKEPKLSSKKTSTSGMLYVDRFIN